MDAAGERLTRESREGFELAVEAARLGAVFSTKQGRRSYSRWKASNSRRSRPQEALSDAALEAAIVRLGREFPGAVTRGTMPA